MTTTWAINKQVIRKITSCCCVSSSMGLWGALGKLIQVNKQDHKCKQATNLTKGPSNLHKAPKFKPKGQELTKLNLNENGSKLGCWEQGRNFSNGATSNASFNDQMSSKSKNSFCSRSPSRQSFQNDKSFVFSIRDET